VQRADEEDDTEDDRVIGPCEGAVALADMIVGSEKAHQHVNRPGGRREQECDQRPIEGFRRQPRVSDGADDVQGSGLTGF
jgi:hypothetical protein